MLLGKPKYDGNHTDEWLVQRYQERKDEHALATLFIRYAIHTQGVCLHYLKAYEQAEDSVMDIIFYIADNLPGKVIENFRHYLFIATRNYCFHYMKRQHRLAEIFSPLSENIPDELMQNPTEETLYQIKESQLEALSKAIDELEHRQRSCVIAFYLHGQSYQQIAQHIEISEGLVRSAIQNGRRLLRLRLN